MLANARLRGNFRSSQGRMRAPAHITIGQLQVRFPTCLRRCPSLQPRQCEPESLMQYLTAGTSRVCLPGDRHSFSLQALRAVDPVCSPTPGLPLLFHWHYAHLCTWCEWPAAHLRCELYGLPKNCLYMFDWCVRFARGLVMSLFAMHSGIALLRFKGYKSWSVDGAVGCCRLPDNAFQNSLGM